MFDCPVVKIIEISYLVAHLKHGHFPLVVLHLVAGLLPKILLPSDDQRLCCRFLKRNSIEQEKLELTNNGILLILSGFL